MSEEQVDYDIFEVIYVLRDSYSCTLMDMLLNPEIVSSVLIDIFREGEYGVNINNILLAYLCSINNNGDLKLLYDFTEIILNIHNLKQFEINDIIWEYCVVIETLKFFENSNLKSTQDKWSIVFTKDSIYEFIKSPLVKRALIKYTSTNIFFSSMDYIEFKKNESARIITNTIRKYINRKKSAIKIQRFYRNYLYSPDVFLSSKLGSKVKKEYINLLVSH